MNKLNTYLFGNKQQQKELDWFRNALYLFLLYKLLTYLINFNTFFSENRLIFHSVKHVNARIDFVFFLNNHYTVLLGIVFISMLGIFSLLGLCKRSNYFSNFLLWCVMMNLSAFLYPTLTAGDYLLNQILFFNIFFSQHASSRPVTNDLKSFLHNISLIALKIQICLAYFISGVYKVQDESWLSGHAIYSTFQIPEFSNALLVSLPFVICVILNYLTMIYQLCFPFLIWIRPLKIWLFLFGICQHLTIAFGMGLVTFGMLMIICYILFLKYDDGVRTESQEVLYSNK